MLRPDTYDCLGELLDDSLLQWKSETALLELDRKRERATLRYLDVRVEVHRVDALLRARGIQPGSRVAIVMSNQSRWLIAAIAVLRAGATLVPIDFKLTGEEQRALLDHSRADALVIEHGYFERLGVDRWIEATHGRAFAVTSEAPPSFRPKTDAVITWESLPPAEPLLPVKQSRDDLAAIVYSSGTGGTPKGCMLSHDAYLEQLRSFVSIFEMRPGHRYFSILPTNHAIDFMAGFIAPFACGATVVHQRTLRPEFIVSTLKDHRITHMSVVPLLLEALETKIDESLATRPSWQRRGFELLSRVNRTLTRDAANPDLSHRLLASLHDELGGHLELLFAGGAFVDRQRVERFYARGIPIAIGYGLTECCVVATVNDLRPFRADSVGGPVDGVEVRILGENADGIGEVLVRGRTLMRGYLDEPELTRRTIDEDGWLHTGDLGRLDASGHLHLVGRSKNMIVTAGGKNVYPEDVEAAFDGLGVEELSVFASGYVWPETRVEAGGPSLVDELLFLVVRASAEADRGELLRGIQQRNRQLAEHKRVAGILFVEAKFPRTASMKLKREALRDALRETHRRDDVARWDLARADGAKRGNDVRGKPRDPNDTRGRTRDEGDDSASAE